MAKREKYRGYENPEAFRAHVQRSQSGAAGTHADKRAKRARTRKAAKRRAINDGE